MRARGSVKAGGLPRRASRGGGVWAAGLVLQPFRSRARRAGQAASSSSSSSSRHHHGGHHPSLKRHNARRDTKRIPLRYQKDRRAKFKSTEDLLHRLYVCISGAADQLQSNYAGDFRSILR